MSLPDDPKHAPDPSPEEFSPAGTFLKLVLLPAAVVLIFVIVGLMVSWLIVPGGDVDSLIDRLARQDGQRWQAAVNLAAVLSEPDEVGVKRDPAVARRLIDVLQRELEEGRMDREGIRLRMYLCRLLGEFHVADPLPVLLEAARLQRSGEEVDVRRSAIEALAVLASHVGPHELRSDPRLIGGLIEGSQHGDRRVREAAAFTLGVVGGEPALARLEIMLTDPHPEVRFNAATGLARHGSIECIETLQEMLDTKRSGSSRAMILINALRAVAQLAAANSEADLSALTPAVERTVHAELEPQISAAAAGVLLRLNDRNDRRLAH